jgi:glycolate oxidase
LLVGSEGTMALVTKIIVRLMRKPEMVKTILAIYDRPEDAGDTVAEITARAITPAAVEMLDGRAAAHGGGSHARRLSMDAGRSADRARRNEGSGGGAGRADSRGCLAPAAPASSAWRATPRSASSVEGPQERLRRGGPLSPAYYVQDGVVPRTQIAPTLRFIGASPALRSGPSATSFTRATATCIR